MSGFKSMSKLARYCLAVGAFAVMSVSGQAEACDGDPSGLTRNCGAVVAPPEFIQISSCGDLQKIGRAANYPLHGRYRLDNDIDLTECSAEWEPVGRSAVSYRTNDCGAQNCDPLPPEQMLFAGAFTGSFDGNGYTIRGLKTERVDPVMPMDAAHVLFILSAGLFGALDGARVDNLTIEADTVAVHGTYAQYSSGTGILAGYSRLSAVTGVNVTGTVAAYLPISNSNENFRLNAGGLIGNSVWDEITRCGSAVTVISEKNTRTDVVVPFDKVIAGGLVGTSEHATIRESRSTVTMTGELGTAGGLVGENNGGVIAKSGADMRFVEFLSKFEVLGGLVGFNKSYYGGSCPGCMDLRLQTGKITESYATVNVGRAANDGSKNWTIGGLAGTNGGEIADCYAIGRILIAYTPNIKLPNITPTDRSGIVLNTSIPDEPTDPVINFAAGGLVGRTGNPADGVSIERSYSAVYIPSAYSIEYGESWGGLVGYRYIPPYSTGPAAPEGDPFTTSYWDTKLSASQMGGVGRTTEEMYQQSTFQGWDFAGIWRIKEGESYPYLAWQNGPASSISWNRTAGAVSKNKLAPAVTVRGKIINIKTSSANDIQVRLIDMKGRTVTRFSTTGGAANFSASKISAGRYLVDMREIKTGKRFTSAVILR